MSPMATQALEPCHFSFSGAETVEKSHWLWVSVNKTPSESPRMKLGLFFCLALVVASSILKCFRHV